MPRLDRFFVWVWRLNGLVITPDEVACEHPKRPREAIRRHDVIRIWHVTTSDGPRLPDEWILLEGDDARHLCWGRERAT